MSSRFGFPFGHNPSDGALQTSLPFHNLPDARAPKDMDGETYEASEDKVRLNKQLMRVWNVMKEGHWRTLEKIAKLAGVNSVASVSARIRDLRKKKFGEKQVERKRMAKGLFLYRVKL